MVLRDFSTHCLVWPLSILFFGRFTLGFGPSGLRSEVRNDLNYGPIRSIHLCCALLGLRFEVPSTWNREQRHMPVRLPYTKLFAPSRCCGVQMARSYQACLTSASVNTTRCLVDVLISAWSKPSGFKPPSGDGGTGGGLRGGRPIPTAPFNRLNH